MSAYEGQIDSLGDYVTIDTIIVREHEDGRQTVGMFDQQKERFINGMKLGPKKFGRMSCPSNLYPHFELNKKMVLYTWSHPFLGMPPVRTGVIGIVYPDEGRAYVIGRGQMVASLVALALLPLLWLIPGIIVGALIGGMLGLPELLTGLIVVLIALSPWIAGGVMAFTYTRMKATYPYSQTP